ncbi:hypothetical protein HPB50_019200 [Hyalomma asiaticum]|uniref:Uncharacterized protein n=1 Tax=Hyalomma asiaticum TaxID=266040 RepID=A0ACB7TRJ2_HYAAI|nr:hypothetical protein HPB50_019200 [Hyalomma asiaticum]
MGRDMSARGNANHTETANEAARGFTYRAAQPADSTEEWWCEAKNRMTEYTEVLKWYRLGRRTMPPPHPGLTRSEAVTYRQLQNGSLPTPVLMKHVCSSVYVSHLCHVCKSERATAAHTLWHCVQNPREARTVTTIPAWLMAAAGSDQLEEQTRAFQWISAALEKQHPSEISRCPLPLQQRGRRGCQKKAGVAKAARRVDYIMPR